MSDFETLMKNKPIGKRTTGTNRSRLTFEAKVAIAFAVLRASLKGEELRQKTDLAKLPECNEKTPIGDMIGKGKGNGGLDLDLVKEGKDWVIKPSAWHAAKAWNWLLYVNSSEPLDFAKEQGFDSLREFSAHLAQAIELEKEQSADADSDEASSTEANDDAIVEEHGFDDEVIEDLSPEELTDEILNGQFD